MASQPEIQNFTNAWNQTAAWAQSKGIKYNDYYPIYQQDTQRLLQYGTPMSQAERERAITAAANVQGATQTTPSTAHNPGNVIGNTITDARNIFTGIGSIFAHPLHNGLTDSVKNTFDLIDGSHKLTGAGIGGKLGDLLSSTVLSWVPGAADIGTVLQADPTLTGSAGASALAEHPLSSIFDVLPLAKPLALVRDPETAARFGATSVEDARKLGPIRTLKGYVMNTKTGKIGPQASGQVGLQTIGDKFHQWSGSSFLNLNPHIADAMGHGEMTMNHWTQVNRAMLADLDRATQDLKPHQIAQVEDVVRKSEQVGMDRAMQGVEDPAVIKALDAWVERNQWETEEALNAVDGLRKVTNIRTGQAGFYSVVGHKAVISARDSAQKAEDALLEALPDTERLAQQTQAAGGFFTKATAGLEKANQAARQVHVEGNLPTTLPGGSKRFPTPFSKDRIAKSLFDTGGWVDRLVEKAKAGDFESVEKISRDTLKRLSSWGVDRVDVGELGAEFQAVREQVVQLNKSAKAVLHARKKASQATHGGAARWTGQKPFRDARHAAEAKNLETAQRLDRSKLAARQREQVSYLHRAYRVKRAEISTRFARARADREHTLTDGTRNINDRYRLETTKLTTRHLQARASHQEWLRGRRAQGLPGATGGLQAAQEGTRIAPGALGSREAIQAGRATLEAARKQEKADLVASLPSKAELAAKQDAEMKAAKLAETQMTKRLREAQQRDERGLIQKQAEARDQLKAENMGKLAREGKLSELVDEYQRTQNEFSKALYEHPSDNFQPVWFNLFAKHLLADERARDSINYKSKVLAEKYGWGQEHLDNVHSNPEVIASLVQLGIHDAYDDPIFDDLDRSLIAAAQQSAYKNLDAMAKAGLAPQWVHHVSATQIRNDELGSAGIRLIVGKGIPKPNVLSPRVWGLNSSKFDVMAAVTHPQRQFLARAALHDYVSTYLDKRVVTAQDILDTMLTHFPDEVSGLDRQSVLDLAAEKMKDWNLVEFDPADRFGFRVPRWGEDKVYLDADLLRAVEKLSAGEGIFKGTVVEKATKLFRYSILGLSPRYDAHIIFGGSFLLAMREPLFFMHIPQMLSDMREGNLPEDLFTAPSNMGTTDWQMLSKQKKLDLWHRQAGTDTAHYLGQEHIEVKQGMDWKKASPLHWLKAMADINLHFTSTVVHMQKGVAYLAGAARAERKDMTPERAAMEGMKNAAAVYGDLRRMSPFERDVARSVMPFYGWQKHILQYVFTFPADHPWRTMMLANMAEYDTSHTPGGLPSRYQFLFFLGQPDAQGNVTAIDTRALNPLRDTANYATWQGLIAGLNPVLTAPLAAIDPQIVYGSNTLYPNLTYDQFYGIKEAGPQGNLLTAAAQIVPQIGGMQSALKLAGQRQGMSDSQLLKSIGNQLNFPWIPQQLNLKQEAARTAIAQYQVTKQLAANAWQTGDFSAIQDLGTVPDPRNADYETPVADLEQLYNALAQQYPGTPPSASAQPLPALHL